MEQMYAMGRGRAAAEWRPDRGPEPKLSQNKAKSIRKGRENGPMGLAGLAEYNLGAYEGC